MDNILLRFQENWQFWIIFLCLASLGSGMVKIINLLNDITAVRLRIGSNP